MVDQAGFAHVGAADDGHRNAVLVLLLLLREVQVGADGIQQVAGAMAVHAGNGHQFSQTQGVEIIQLHGRVADLVALVHGQHHRLAAAHEHGSHLVVLGGHPGPQVGDHDDAVGGINGHLGLLTHVGQNAVVDAGLDTAGIHQQELVAVPFAVAEDTVPGNAGGILHNGDALAGEFVEDGGLAHVGAAHDGHDRFCHVVIPPLACGGRI